MIYTFSPFRWSLLHHSLHSCLCRCNGCLHCTSQASSLRASHGGLAGSSFLRTDLGGRRWLRGDQSLQGSTSFIYVADDVFALLWVLSAMCVECEPEVGGSLVLSAEVGKVLIEAHILYKRRYVQSASSEKSPHSVRSVTYRARQQRLHILTDRLRIEPYALHVPGIILEL